MEPNYSSDKSKSMSGSYHEDDDSPNKTELLRVGDSMTDENEQYDEIRMDSGEFNLP